MEETDEIYEGLEESNPEELEVSQGKRAESREIGREDETPIQDTKDVAQGELEEEESQDVNSLYSSPSTALIEQGTSMLPTTRKKTLNYAIDPVIRQWYSDAGIFPDASIPTFTDKVGMAFAERQMLHNFTKQTYLWAKAYLSATVGNFGVNEMFHVEDMESLEGMANVTESVKNNIDLEKLITKEYSDLKDLDQTTSEFLGILESGYGDSPSFDFREYAQSQATVRARSFWGTVSEIHKGEIEKMNDAYREKWQNLEAQKRTAQTFNRHPITDTVAQLLGGALSLVSDPVGLGVAVATGATAIAVLPEAVVAVGVATGMEAIATGTVVATATSITASGVGAGLFEVAAELYTKSMTDDMIGETTDLNLGTTFGMGFAFGAGFHGLLMGLGFGAKAVVNGGLSGFLKSSKLDFNKPPKGEVVGEFSDAISTKAEETLKEMRDANKDLSIRDVINLANEKVADDIVSGGYNEVLSKAGEISKNSNDYLPDYRTYNRVQDAMIKALNDEFGTAYPRKTALLRNGETIYDIHRRMPEIPLKDIITQDLNEVLLNQMSRIEEISLFRRSPEGRESLEQRLARGLDETTPTEELEAFQEEWNKVQAQRQELEGVLEDGYALTRSSETLSQEKRVADAQSKLDRGLEEGVFKEDLDDSIAETRQTVSSLKERRDEVKSALDDIPSSRGDSLAQERRRILNSQLEGKRGEIAEAQERLKNLTQERGVRESRGEAERSLNKAREELEKLTQKDRKGFEKGKKELDDGIARLQKEQARLEEKRKRIESQMPSSLEAEMLDELIEKRTLGIRLLNESQENFQMRESPQTIAQRGLVEELSSQVASQIERRIFKEDLDGVIARKNEQLKSLRDERSSLISEINNLTEQSVLNARARDASNLRERLGTINETLRQENKNLRDLRKDRGSRESVKSVEAQLRREEARLEKLNKKDRKAFENDIKQINKERDRSLTALEALEKELKSIEGRSRDEVRAEIARIYREEVEKGTTLKKGGSYSVDTPQAFSVSEWVAEHYPEDWLDFVNSETAKVEDLYLKGAERITKELEKLAVEHPKDMVDRVIQMEKDAEQVMTTAKTDLTRDFGSGDEFVDFLRNENELQVRRVFDVWVGGGTMDGLSKQQKAFLQGVRRTYKRLLATRRALGEPMRELQNYAPAKFDLEKLTIGGQESFVDNMVDRINWDRTRSSLERGRKREAEVERQRGAGADIPSLEDEVGRRKYLSNLWDEAFQDAQPYGAKLGAKVDFRYSRTLHFRTGSAYYDTLADYGIGESVHEMVLAPIRSESRNIALLQTFGGEGAKGLKGIRDVIREASHTAPDKYRTPLRHLNNIYNSMTTQVGQANRGFWTKFYEASRSLNLSMLVVNSWKYAAIEEPMRMASVAREFGFLNGKDTIQAFIKYSLGLNKMDRASRELLLGNIKRTREIDYLSNVDTLAKVGDKAAQMTYKYTGTDWLTLKNKEMTTLTWQNSMAKLRNTPWNELADKQKKWFKRSGLSPSRWEEFRGVAEKGIAVYDGVEYFSPLILREAGHKALAEDLMRFQIAFQKNAVVESSHLVTTAILGAGSNRTDVLGAVIDSFTSLTSTPLNLYYQFYKTDGWARLLAYVPYAIISGLIINELEALSEGTTLDVSNPTDAVYHLMHAFVKGGGGGLPSDLTWGVIDPLVFGQNNGIHNAVNAAQGKVSGAFAGQTLGQIGDLAQTIKEVYEKGNTESIKRLEHMFPVLRWMPAKLAINRLILDDLHKKMSKDYYSWAYRQEDKIRDKRRRPITPYALPKEAR